MEDTDLPIRPTWENQNTFDRYSHTCEYCEVMDQDTAVRVCAKNNEIKTFLETLGWTFAEGTYIACEGYKLSFRKKMADRHLHLDIEWISQFRWFPRLKMGGFNNQCESKFMHPFMILEICDIVEEYWTPEIMGQLETNLVAAIGAQVSIKK